MQELDLDRLRAGGKASLARALATIERAPSAPGITALLDAAWLRPQGRVIGITGPPGVGKSTLAGALIRRLRERELTVAVIAVDPSSKRSGGALLGDRLRLRADPEDAGTFVRSMAARDRLGGLAALTWSAAILMRALFDRVIVETVGVGQSETDVAGLADTVVFCVQPGSGDSLQFMKAGIVEIPHVAVVTKMDVGLAAGRALADLRGALSLAVPEDGWSPRCLGCSVHGGEGLEELDDALEAHWAALDAAGPAERRRRQAGEWLRSTLRERIGSRGMARAGPVELSAGEAPFGRLVALETDLWR